MFMLYGMHWAFNVVSGCEGEPHAALIRAIEPVEPSVLMCARRNMPANRKQLCNGPGKLCAALGLDRRHYGVNLCAGKALFLATDDAAPPEIAASAWINIAYAGDWVKTPWRFYARGCPWVSVAPRN